MTMEVFSLVNWVFNDTSELPWRLQWKRPQSSGQGLQSEGSVQIPRATHKYAYPPSPPPTLALWPGDWRLRRLLSSGLVKLNHSCWACPEENHRQDRGKGAFRQTQCYCYCSLFCSGGLAISEQQLQSSGVKESIRKQYMLYPGTRERNSLHPINGSHPLWDDYRASVLPCSHANMLSMLTKKARPFLFLCFSIWPRGFLNGCVEITGVQMWLLTHLNCHSVAHLCICLLFSVAPSCTFASLSPVLVCLLTIVTLAAVVFTVCILDD